MSKPKRSGVVNREYHDAVVECERRVANNLRLDRIAQDNTIAGLKAELEDATKHASQNWDSYLQMRDQRDAANERVRGLRACLAAIHQMAEVP